MFHQSPVREQHAPVGAIVPVPGQSARAEGVSPHTTEGVPVPAASKTSVCVVVVVVVVVGWKGWDGGGGGGGGAEEQGF